MYFLNGKKLFFLLILITEMLNGQPFNPSDIGQRSHLLDFSQSSQNRLNSSVDTSCSFQRFRTMYAQLDDIYQGGILTTSLSIGEGISYNFLIPYGLIYKNGPFLKLNFYSFQKEDTIRKINQAKKVHFLLDISRNDIFHPPELSKSKSKGQVDRLFMKNAHYLMIDKLI